MKPLPLLVAGCFFMEFLDGTIIAPALPQMAVSLGSTAVDLHVGISAYLLTVAVMILPGGWAAERFGARTVFAAAIGIFTVASGLCALAGSPAAFVAARVLQGVGGAMMVPVGRLVVLRGTEKAGLMRAIALLTWPGLTAPLIGPPLGGLIAEHLDWRYIFLVNLPLGVVAFGLALWWTPGGVSGVKRRFDGVGFALAGTACLCVELTIDFLGRDPPVLEVAGLLAVVGLASGVGAGRHLRRSAAPLIDPGPWRVETFRLVLLVGTAMRAAISTLPFLLPLLFQLGFGYDPFQAGALVLALFAGNIGIKPLTSAILRRFGFRTVLVGNGMVQAGALFGLAAMGPGTPLGVLLAVLTVAGASRSMQFTALGTLAFADVPEAGMAAANTWFSVSFQLGTGMGVGVGALLLQGAGGALGLGTGLGAFRVAFALLGVAMLGLAGAALMVPNGAGAAVSGSRR